MNANNTNGISFTLTGTDTNTALISLDWGDDSQRERQRLGFTHIYSNGTYQARLLVVDDGAIHTFDMSVSVTCADGTVETLNVNTFPVVPMTNSAVVPGGLLPDFDFVRATSIVFATNGNPVIQYLAVPDLNYTIETSSRLSDGFEPITNKAADTNGALIFEDSRLPREGQRFYRAKYP